MNIKQILLTVASLAVAALLLSMLLISVELPLQKITNTLLNFSPLNFIIIVLLGTLCLFLSQERWQCLQHYYKTEKPMRRASAFLYTCIGTNLSQFLPPQVSIALARSSGSWLEKTSSPMHSAALTIFEQLFDVLILASVLVFSLLFLGGFIGFIQWIGFSLCFLFLVLLVLLWFSDNLEKANSNIYDLLLRIPVLKHKIATSDSVTRETLRYPSRQLLIRLYLYSVLRFCGQVMSALMVAAVVLADYQWWELGPTIPIMLLSFLIPITPGALGVTEWAWASVITLIGVPIAIAAEFAIVCRIVGVVAHLTINLFAYFYWQWARSTSSRRITNG